jgi:tetratricopeptide (TPR) repeat protein
MRKDTKNVSIVICFLLFFSVFNIAGIHAQNYKNNYKADICQCLQDENLSSGFIENAYKKCFKRHLTTYAVLIDAGIKEENISLKYIEGQKIRLELQQQFMHELMYSCDVYFYSIERARQELKVNKQKTVNSTKLQEYHERVAMHPNSQSYYLRAQLYFNLKDFNNAEKDLLKSIDLNPYGENKMVSRNEKLLLAWVYEEQKRYNEAIAVFDEIYLGMIDTQVLIIKAIVSRKRDGRYNFSLNNIVSVSSEDQRNTNIGKPKNNTQTTNVIKPVSTNSRRAIRNRSNVRTKKDSTKLNKIKPAKSKDSTKSLRSLFKLGNNN